MTALDGEPMVGAFVFLLFDAVEGVEFDGGAGLGVTADLATAYTRSGSIAATAASMTPGSPAAGIASGLPTSVNATCPTSLMM